MLLQIDALLTDADVASIRKDLASAQWIDGRETAGGQAASVKHNRELARTDRLARELGLVILARLGANQQFRSAALPQEIHPPIFNAHADGGGYGPHVDCALMELPDGRTQMRSDISASVFLSDPADYDGGELVIATDFGEQSVKLPAGSMVLYPSSSLHRVDPVTRGERLCAVSWIQSTVSDQGERAILYALDHSVMALGKPDADVSETRRELTNVYHNLLRRWSDN